MAHLNPTEWADRLPAEDAFRRRRIVMGATVPETVRHFMKDQAAYFCKLGWDVHLVASPGVALTVLQQEFRDSAGLHVHALAMERNPSPLSDLRSLASWLKLLRQIQPDVVMSGTPKAGLLGMLAARVVGVPRRIYLVRGLRLESQHGLAAAISWGAEALASRAATSVLCVSPSVRSEMLRRHITSRRKARVLGSGSSNGVDAEAFRPATTEERRLARQRFNIPQDSLVVGFAGRLTPDKGIDSLLAAMKAVVAQEPRVLLLLVGDSDDASPLTSSTLSSLGLPWIHHFKRVEDMHQFYWALDVFCLPSLREGMPNVNLESGASGVPVVTTRATGCCDSVLDGVTGLQVPTQDPLALAESIHMLLKDDERRGSMGLSGRLWVIHNFRRERVWSQLLSAIEGHS